MSKIEIGRWSEQLRKMLGQKGQEVVAGDLSPEISPTIQLEQPAAEWDFLKGVRGCAVGLELTGQVGFRSNARLRNPTASGVIASVEFISWSGANDQDVRAARGTETTDLAVGTVDTTVLDQRWQAGALPQRAAIICSVTNLDAVGVVGRIFFRSNILASTTFFYPKTIILVPGTNLDWEFPTLNRTLFANAYWTERALPLLEA